MNRWQTIVWTKDSLVYRHIQMFQGIIELMPINPFNFLTYLNSSLCFLCPNITFNSSPPSAAYMRHYWVSIGSSNGLLSVQRQAITWTNAGLLSIGHLGTNFSEIQIEIQKFSFMKMISKHVVCDMAAIFARRRLVNTWDGCRTNMATYGRSQTHLERNCFHLSHHWLR